jgi:hypothetical protein
MPTREERLIPNGNPRYIRCYDNGGVDAKNGSGDRYTIVFTRADKIGLPGFYLASSAHPFHPQGIGQTGEGKQAGGSTIDRPKSSHLGKRIAFDKLPEDVRTFVEQTYREVWKVPKK